MAASEPVLRFRASADPGSVRALREELGRFLTTQGLDEQTAFDIKLAVTEAANNVLMHAYGERRSAGPLLVEARVRGQRVVVSVADEGSGPAPRADSPGAGLGMPMMATLADEVDVRRRETGGTHVELSFRVA